MANDYWGSLQKPVLVYDGDCSFCKYWVNRWRRRTGDKIAYVPYQEVPDGFHGITHAQFSKSVYLFTRYGQRLHGAEAVAALLHLSGYSVWSWLYHRLPLASTVAEAGYRLVADHRDFFYKLTKLIFRGA
ncbi:thiol-disulfide oxidoreductase DCC family protein [Pontibacter anaerobius]|uniref:DCC1-like thiol-disulfide oxidoreductase family protein n=1 Tax=Pontibacter anaerobius TaxID=2993940 RepID=A0ABT3R9M6_9BACT|nr:DCC1-like thiol-disulfide oxidoreductase family protein [Pontibacter anaerobius]MCX2738410.1 DCC1-like thiol-disulfide oxidoreductase family protein [Pontibacter anaerobius]